LGFFLCFDFLAVYIAHAHIHAHAFKPYLMLHSVAFNSLMIQLSSR